MAPPYRAIVALVAVAAALVCVPHRVANLCVRAAVKGLTLHEYVLGDAASPVSPQYRAFRRLLGAGAAAKNRTVEGSRRRLETALRVLAPLDPDVRTAWHGAATADGAVAPLLWVNTSRRAAAPVILHLHPGGYVSGSAAASAGSVAAFGALAGADLLSVDYRRSPEHTPAAAVEDAVAAYRWLLGLEAEGEGAGGASRARTVGAGQVVVMGESAGGGLAVLLLLALRARGLPLPAGAVLASPYVDTTDATSAPENHLDPVLPAASLRWFAAIHRPSGRAFSPVFLPAAAFASLPPVHVVSGAVELLLPGIEELCGKLREAGVNATCVAVPHMPHAFTVFHDWVPEAAAAVADAARFIRFALGRDAAN